MSTRTAARHRRPVRARTPLRAIGDAVSTNATTVSRRSAVIAASSGLIVTMGLPTVVSPLMGAADAAPEAGAAASRTAAPAVPAQRAADAAPVTARVSAAPEARVSFALSALTTVDAAQHEAEAAAAADAAHTAEVERAAAADAAQRQADEAASARRATTVSRETTREEAGGAATAATAAADDDAATASAASASSTASPTASSAPSASSSASSASSASASVSGSAVVDVAKRYVGIDYRYGGTTPAGFDCSGFVQYVYAQLGVDLPRTSGEQAQAGTRVPRSQAQPGDIVSFVGRGGVYHNGIYLGGGQMLDSPRTGQAIGVHDIWSSSVVFTHVAS